MSYARLEAEHGLQWPCYDENHPGELFLHSRLWERPLNGPRVAFHPVEHDPPVERLTEEFPLRLTTGRRLDEYNTGVQTAGYASPLRRGESLDISPEDAERLGIRDGEVVRVFVPPRRDRGAGADRRGPASGAHLHDASLPGRGRHQYPDHRRHGPQVGDRGIQGRRHPGRAAGSDVRRWTSTSTAPKRRRPSKPPSIPSWGHRHPPGRAGHGTWKMEGHSTLLGGHAARSRRDLLLPALHAVQSRFGWVPPGALDYICRRLTVPPAEAHGVVTFYHLFSLTPQPLAVAHVCDDIACRIKGAESLCAELEHTLGPEGKSGWKRSPCLGRCEQAPAALVLNAGESPRANSLAPATTAGIVAARALEGGESRQF